MESSMEHLEENACLELLNSHHFGRVAFVEQGEGPPERTGWSVVVSGRAEEVADPRELNELSQTPLLPWAPGDRSLYVRITPELVTGRCISVADLPSNWWG